MDRINILTKNRTKRAVSRVFVAAQGWIVNKQNAFENCKKAFAKQVTLSSRDPTQRLCV